MHDRDIQVDAGKIRLRIMNEFAHTDQQGLVGGMRGRRNARQADPPKQPRKPRALFPIDEHFTKPPLEQAKISTTFD
ncbi:hypothetical protein [Sphingomonas aquatica]|uniref:hypothetical protein n=1 Tax=Sphingomonas aquatica TaxID=1763824 RepID=UPI00301B8B08